MKPNLIPTALLTAALALVGCLPLCFAQGEMGAYQNPPAQEQAPPSKSKVRHAEPKIAKPSAATAAPAQPDKPASLLEQPAQPAKIDLLAGKLTVAANNSDLAAILHEIAKESGMKIDGLAGGVGANQRVFGSYGPGSPQNVLSELLSDSGYNVLMLGVTSSGAPRELALTARNGGAAAAPAPAATAPQPQPQNNDDNAEPPPEQGEEQSNPDEPPVPPQIRNGVRTPQQLLQELQRMRQQQQQDQQDQPQDDQPQD